MICLLGKSLGCEGLNKDNTCSVFHDEGVKLRMTEGICVFKNIRAPRVGIYSPKKGKMLNPLKAAKAEARNKAIGA